MMNNTQPLILYILTHCPYCHRVRAFMEEHGLDVEYRDITKSDHQADLLKRGGKKQVPYLVDSSRDTEMYESGDIIDYLEQYYI